MSSKQYNQKTVFVFFVIVIILCVNGFLFAQFSCNSKTTPIIDNSHFSESIYCSVISRLCSDIILSEDFHMDRFHAWTDEERSLIQIEYKSGYIAGIKKSIISDEAKNLEPTLFGDGIDIIKKDEQLMILKKGDIIHLSLDNNRIKFADDIESHKPKTDYFLYGCIDGSKYFSSIISLAEKEIEDFYDITALRTKNEPSGARA